MGGSNSVPGEGRSLSTGFVIPAAGGKGRNLPFSKGFPDFSLSFTVQKEKAARAQGRRAPEGTCAVFNLLKGFWNFPHRGGIGATPCRQGEGRLQPSGQLRTPQVTER